MKRRRKRVGRTRQSRQSSTQACSQSCGSKPNCTIISVKLSVNTIKTSFVCTIRVSVASLLSFFVESITPSHHEPESLPQMNDQPLQWSMALMRRTMMMETKDINQMITRQWTANNRCTWFVFEMEAPTKKNKAAPWWGKLCAKPQRTRGCFPVPERPNKKWNCLSCHFFLADWKKFAASQSGI